jgi:hypothetical protein
MCKATATRTTVVTAAADRGGSRTAAVYTATTRHSMIIPYGYPLYR